MKTCTVSFFFFILLIQYTFSQDPAELRVKNYIWKSNDPDFAVNKCNDKWEKESAVILCRKYEYEVRKEAFLRYIYQNIYSHTRILLQDKAAVEKFSTFSFDISKRTGYYSKLGSLYKDIYNIFLGLKVIKPGQKEQEVMIDEKLIDEIKSGNNLGQFQKVAIPNLEVGDILDYYVAFESRILGNETNYAFSPVLYHFADEYPIQKQKLEMHIMRKCYLSARAMNGAPKLEFKENLNQNNFAWTIVDSDRQKATNQIMEYSLRELPILAFQAYYIRFMEFNNLDFFVDEGEKIKVSVGNKELTEFFTKAFKPKDYEMSNSLMKYLKKYKNVNDPSIIAREAYYYTREYNFARRYEYNVANGRNLVEKVNEFAFIDLLSSVFKEKKINHSIIVTIPREIGKMEDLIIRGQMGFLIKVNTEHPLYFSNVSRYSLITEIDPSYQGNNAKYIEAKYKYDNVTPDVKDITIPESKHTENVLSHILDVSFYPEKAEKLLVSEQIKAIGCQKGYYQNAFIMQGDIVKEYRENRYHFFANELSSNKAKNYINQLIEKDNIERQNRLTNYLKNEFGSENVKGLKIELIQPGMWDDKPEFIMNYDFELDKYISKVGDNIILEIGKLIGEQIKPEITDSIRKYNIYQSFARGYEYTINVPIPVGYKLKGTENLKFEVTNETGGFTSSGAIEGNKLIVKVTKYYTKNFYPKEKWPLMVQFLNAALDFQEQKVMFVPSN